MPIHRRAPSAHDRLAALAAGTPPAGATPDGASAPSRGWLPVPPSPPEEPAGAGPAPSGRVVLPFVRARRAASPVPPDEGAEPDPWEDEPWPGPGDDTGPRGAADGPHDRYRDRHGPRHRARHRAEGPQGGLVPATVRGGRWRVRPRAAAGALLALAVLAGVLALRAGAPGEGTTVVPARPGETAGGPSAAGVAAGSPTDPGSPPVAAVPAAPGGAVAPAGIPGPELVVHVVGQVLEPGLVRLAAGARVADAVEAAGGATAEADLGRVNLARAVVDGEQVVLPLPGEPLAAADAGGSAGGTGASGAGAAGTPVDLNAADHPALDALPGIGPVLAQRILDWRTENGRFSSVEELGEVTGIGDTLLSRLRESVTV